MESYTKLGFSTLTWQSILPVWVQGSDDTSVPCLSSGRLGPSAAVRTVRQDDSKLPLNICPKRYVTDLTRRHILLTPSTIFPSPTPSEIRQMNITASFTPEMSSSASVAYKVTSTEAEDAAQSNLVPHHAPSSPLKSLKPQRLYTPLLDKKRERISALLTQWYFYFLHCMRC